MFRNLKCVCLENYFVKKVYFQNILGTKNSRTIHGFQEQLATNYIANLAYKILS